MKQGKELIEGAARGIRASQTTSTTAAGPADGTPSGDQDLVDAINQVFALFRLNYHNQYYSAFQGDAQLRQIKRLWLEALGRTPPGTVLRAAKRCIEESEYLPTVHRFLAACAAEQWREAGLPEVYDAYREACLAPEPKAAQDWSHPAVYYAGREAGWHLLAGSPESQALPRFRSVYERWCERVLAGETLAPPQRPVLPDPGHRPAAPATRARCLAEINNVLKD
jgi:hypothetical protein